MNSSPVEAPVFYEPDGTTNHVKWGTTDRLITAYQGNPVAQLTTGYMIRLKVRLSPLLNLNRNWIS